MKKRYDYRNDYKGWSMEQIEKHIPYLKQKLAKNIGICDNNAADALKRLSYLQSKMETK